ncbi:SPFH/Band 7/PHB domain protein [bacterium]|jgi:regulator of protease activity HflC (stomatin/prohibitin superfamily)|nr:SPFH/Band 7/PHB domain protein [bacterium]
MVLLHEFGFVFAAIVLFFFVFLMKGMYLVQQAETLVVERFGRFFRVLGPGLHFVVPFIDSPRKVLWTFVRCVDGKRYHRFVKVVDKIDLRESVYDFPKQNVITKDNVTIEINALLYYQITDPKAAVYEVNNLPEAIEKLTQTTLRNVIGSLDLDESLVSRDQINEKLRLILDEATDKWGVKINRVELQEVNPPIDIRQAMEKQMRAERDRRAIILESEGKKRAAILESEGVKASEVLRATGKADAQVIQATAEAEARIKIAEGEAKVISLIQKSVPNADPLPYLIASKYIKALPELTKGHDNKLIILPYESSSLIGSLASVKTMFENIKN